MLKKALFDDHQELLQPLMEFVADRGRLPADFEISISAELREIFGSVRKAFRIVSLVTGDEQWEEIKEAHSRDFLVYLALSKFNTRPKFAIMSLLGFLKPRCGSGRFLRIPI